MKLIQATVVSAAIVLISPFMGQLQSFLRRSLTTENYVLLFGTAVLLAIGGSILYAVLRIRERRLARFGAMAAALMIGGAYLWATATPWPEVNAVERVHFVEYGLIAVLYYRARPRQGFGEAGSGNDVSLIIEPLLLAFMVGTLDEWLQWFIPVRVGEAHDVFLNLVSIGCGLTFATALQPPASYSWSLRPQTRVRVGFVSAAVWLVFAGFVSQVHLGQRIRYEGIGEFLSHYSATRLDELQAHRAALWKTQPPKTLRRLSREDQYMDEGLWHVRRRNMTDGNEAWGENLILERFYAPVLDTSTYASPEGNRWSAEQRANMEARLDPRAPAFVSAANPYPIWVWPRALFWSISISVALVCLATAMFSGRRGNVTSCP